MRFTNIVAAAALAGASACSGPADAPAGGEVAAEPAGDAADAGLEITPGHLAGEWCYLKFEAGDEISQENITYDFAADGTLKYQTAPGTPVDKDGSYVFENGLLTIKPALAMIPLKPVSLGDQEMVFTAMGGRFTWSRGTCAGA